MTYSMNQAAPPAPLVYEGFGCVATLDFAQAALFLQHDGMAVPNHKKASSPWIIPLGAIERVDFKEKSVTSRGWMRVVLHDRTGWAETTIEDVNAFLAGKQKLGPFVTAIDTARQGVPFAPLPAVPAASTLQRMNDRYEERADRHAELASERAAQKARRDEDRAASRGSSAIQSPLRPDIQAAKDRLRIRLGGGREFKNLESQLWAGETVDLVCVGTYGRGQGLLVLTDRRLLFIFHGIMAQRTEDFPLDRVSSIQWAASMLHGTVSIFASGNKAEITAVQKDDGKALVDRVRAIISGQADPRSHRGVNSAGPANIQSGAGASGPVTAPAPPPPPPPAVPAGWYPDPNNNALQRYWDGSGWTEHTAPAGPPAS